MDMSRTWHLVCEWTALEFVGPAGMLGLDVPAKTNLSATNGTRGGLAPEGLTGVRGEGWLLGLPSAVGNPGGHYKLLYHIASQLRDELIVELGTMHGGNACVIHADRDTCRHTYIHACIHVMMS